MTAPTKIEAALAVLERAALCLLRRGLPGVTNELRESRATLSAHIAAQDKTVGVVLQVQAELNSENARLREFVKDCADGLPEWRPGECRKRAAALIAALESKP